MYNLGVKMLYHTLERIGLVVCIAKVIVHIYLQPPGLKKMPMRHVRCAILCRWDLLMTY